MTCPQTLNLSSPNKNYLTGAGGNEAHSCGEVLVAAVLNTFVSIWVKRLQHLGDESKLTGHGQPRRRRAGRSSAQCLHSCHRLLSTDRH